MLLSTYPKEIDSIQCYFCRCWSCIDCNQSIEKSQVETSYVKHLSNNLSIFNMKFHSG